MLLSTMRIEQLIAIIIGLADVKLIAARSSAGSWGRTPSREKRAASVQLVFHSPCMLDLTVVGAPDAWVFGAVPIVQVRHQIGE